MHRKVQPLLYGLAVLILIGEAEEPHRDFVAKTDFNIVSHNVTVWQVGNLGEALLLASDLEYMGFVNLQVALLGILDGMVK